MMRNLTLFAAAMLLAFASARAAEPTELNQIERQIKRQPAYTAEKPLYGLYVFGPGAKTGAWAVLDKSAAENKQYDILYFDRNGNGDLTEKNERIVGELSERGQSVSFSIGDFTDPRTHDVHTSLTLTRDAGDDGSVMLRLKWRDREMMRGGYAEEPGPYTQFATTVAEAPILWFDASGEFGVQPWMLKKDITIGGSADVRVFLGHEGSGKNTFCAVSQGFLPSDVSVLATLIYTDSEGREQRQPNEFSKRC